MTSTSSTTSEPMAPTSLKAGLRLPALEQQRRYFGADGFLSKGFHQSTEVAATTRLPSRQVRPHRSGPYFGPCAVAADHSYFGVHSSTFLKVQVSGTVGVGRGTTLEPMAPTCPFEERSGGGGLRLAGVARDRRGALECPCRRRSARRFPGGRVGQLLRATDCAIASPSSRSNSRRSPGWQSR